MFGRIIAAVAALWAVAAPAGDAVDRIAETGALRLGFRADAPPFSYSDAEGRPQGLAVALCEDVAAHVAASLKMPGLRRDWIPVTSRTRFEAIRAGEIDLLCGPTTQTLERRRTMDFSIPYFIDGAGVVFRRGGAERLEALSQEPVGVLAGTTTERLAPELLKEAGVAPPVVTYASHVEGLSALQRGEIEAYFGDQSILYYQLGRMQPSVPLVISPRQLSFEPYALAMGRGETRLRLLVDEGLSRVYRAGAIYERIRGTLGRVNLSKLTEAVYEVVAIPD